MDDNCGVFALVFCGVFALVPPCNVETCSTATPLLRASECALSDHGRPASNRGWSEGRGADFTEIGVFPCAHALTLGMIPLNPQAGSLPDIICSHCTLERARYEHCFGWILQQIVNGNV